MKPSSICSTSHDASEIAKEEIAKAKYEYQMSILNGEGRPEAYERMVWIYCLTGDRKSAVAWKNKAKRRVPEAVMAEIDRTIRLYDETGSWPSSKKGRSVAP